MQVGASTLGHVNILIFLRGWTLTVWVLWQMIDQNRSDTVDLVEFGGLIYLCRSLDYLPCCFHSVHNAQNYFSVAFFADHHVVPLTLYLLLSLSDSACC